MRAARDCDINFEAIGWCDMQQCPVVTDDVNQPAQATSIGSLHLSTIINPRRACAARVTVLGLCVRPFPFSATRRNKTVNRLGTALA